ncbi:50S ribosomal protein L4 [Candidatus Gracilibacteria bacterium]|nr:50S ribosomal protein L4 [Candidatus Gracilibacteria bacterium]
METKVLDQTGKEVGSVELNEKVFGLEVNTGLIHRALLLQLANARQNLAHTKTRGERRGSTRKIYKQKGTGRARMGGNRSPVRKGGGVVFGPRNNQNFTLGMNKKERQKALFCTLSSKLADGKLVVVNTITLPEIKTSKALEIYNALPLGKNALVALAARDEVVERSTNNIKNIKMIQSGYLNIADLLKYETLILAEDVVKNLNASAS